MGRTFVKSITISSVLMTGLLGCVSSGPKEQDLQFVVRGEMPYIEQRFQECYRLQTEKDASLRGNIIIKFAIGQDGKAAEYSEVKNTMTGSEISKRQLSGCIKDVLLNSQFQNMDGLGEDFFDVQYPIKFNPAE